MKFKGVSIFQVRALAAIRRADAGRFRLVFGGGTALSRAHRLTLPMSEDIDLKIVAGVPSSRKELRRLRDNITDSLRDAGFAFDPANRAHRESGNESRYTIYRLPYSPLATDTEVLRPVIQIETALWPLRRPSVDRDVASFFTEAFGLQPELSLMPCADHTETVAEKFVALTRRAGEEQAEPDAPRDTTLVRHVYDLHIVLKNCDWDEVIGLVREIMQADAEAYGHRFHAYRADPITETLRAVKGLERDEGYSRTYDAFTQHMVYGEIPEFGTALATVAALAERLRDR